MGKLDIQGVEPAKKSSLSLSSLNHSLRSTSHLVRKSRDTDSNKQTQWQEQHPPIRKNERSFFVLFPRKRFILELSLSLQENQRIVVGFKKKKKNERDRHSVPRRRDMQEVRQVRHRKATRPQCLRRRCLRSPLLLHRSRNRICFSCPNLYRFNNFFFPFT